VAHVRSNFPNDQRKIVQISGWNFLSFFPYSLRHFRVSSPKKNRFPISLLAAGEGREN
jgi:hypothetical protein